MFTKMLAFEWRYFTKQPSFIVTSLVFFLLPYLAMSTPNVQIGAGGNVNFNSPAAIAQTLLILGIFAMFLVVNFVSNTALRNDSSKMAEIVYAKPISSFSYLLGRFLGAYLVCVTVFSMVPLGIFVGSLMPWVDAERVGPNSLSYYVTPFVTFSITTLFVLASVFYAAALKFRSVMAVYLVALGLFIFYLSSGQLLNDPNYRTIAALSDPFGFRTFADVTRYWTPFERNSEVVGLGFDIVWQSRLIWLGVGVTLLALFGGFGKALKVHRPIEKKNKKNKKKEVIPIGNTISVKGASYLGWKHLVTRTKFEIKQILYSPAFPILLVIVSFFLITSLISPSQFYDVPNWPLTQTMVQLIQGNFAIMMIIIITYYSGESVWRERSVGMGDIVDSMPVFNFTFWLSKLVSVCLVVLAVFVFGMIVTVGYQLVKGYTAIQLGQYLFSILYFYAIPWFMLVVLAFFFQALSPNKYIGMLVMVGFFFVSLAFNLIGLEHNLFNLINFAPQLQYSDMNGYGWFIQTQSWYTLYWGALCVVLGVVSYGLWQRGPQMALKEKLRVIGANVGGPGLLAAYAGVAIFIGSGGWIYYNTTVLNTFVKRDAGLDVRADYEKAFGEFENAPIPTITVVDATVDVYPYKRRIESTATMEMVNRSDKPISRFLVNLPQFSPIKELKIEGGTMGEIDEKFNVAWFEFDSPMQPGEMRKGTTTVVRQHVGFKDRGEDTTLVANGTFINNGQLYPNFGFSQGRKIVDQHERRKRDLPPPKRANPIDAEEFYTDNFFGQGVGLIDFSATVSTVSDQIAIAPGYLQREWQKDGRNYYRYEMDAPMINFFNVMSAKLELKKESYKGVNIEVYYHDTHDWNVDRMMEGVRDSIDYFTDEFGPYQHDQMRIIEFPGYQVFAQSFANTVPYSERIGFISDIRDRENIDPVYYVTAHEVAHQWWGHQVGAANVQGSAIISETLSQYSALMVMERKYGESKMRKFLTYELDRYLQGRTTELLGEQPLMLAENQAYIHYRKGSVVMMSLKDKLGEEKLNRALKGMIDDWKFREDLYPTTKDLIAKFKQEANTDESSYIDSLFKDITLYDLVAKSATAQMNDDNKYTVSLDISAARFVADGKGKEDETPLDEWVDIVLFTNDPDDFAGENDIIYRQKHKVVSGDNTIEITVDKEPKFAGVDPFVRFIDRDTGNNILRISG
jgi:ABC-2 type transport system permease protein